MSQKKRVVFVGSFQSKSKTGHVGGQMFASRTLVESYLSDRIDWLKIDSTADSNVLASLIHRARKAMSRILILLRYLIFNKVDALLIFTADGWSFVEKGIMVLLGKLFFKQVLLSPRSGIVLRDVENSAFMRWYIPFILRRCDKVICQGESWRKFYMNLTHKARPEQFTVIQNWINTDAYVALKKAQNRVPKILFLSWVDKNKGIFELLEACKDLYEEKYEFELHIGGKGAATDDVNTFINEHGLEKNIQLHGWVLGNQKLQLLEKSDIYILPSYFEGFPNSLMEAMTAARACIATDVGSIPDLIEDGKNGVLVKARDVNTLKTAIKQLLENKQLLESLAKEARITTLRENSVEVAVRKFEQILC